MTPDGFPLGYEALPGPPSDKTTLHDVPHPSAAKDRDAVWQGQPHLRCISQGNLPRYQVETLTPPARENAMDPFDDIDRQSAAVVVAALITQGRLGVNLDEAELWKAVANYQLDMAEALGHARQERLFKRQRR